LAVGAEDKTGMWVVTDGDVFYMDFNGDRDLTGADERVPVRSGWKPREVVIGGTPVTVVSLQQTFESFTVRVDVKGKRLQYGLVRPARRREDAPVLRFDGVLAMGLAHEDPTRQPLGRGSKPHDFAALITTAGPQKAFCGLVIDHKKYVPPDAHPVAEFEFAPPGAGRPPIKLKAVLDRRC